MGVIFSSPPERTVKIIATAIWDLKFIYRRVKNTYYWQVDYLFVLFILITDFLTQQLWDTTFWIKIVAAEFRHYKFKCLNKVIDINFKLLFTSWRHKMYIHLRNIFVCSCLPDWKCSAGSDPGYLWMWSTEWLHIWALSNAYQGYY